MRLLDLGCGANKHQGYIGIDVYPFNRVDIVRDLRRGLPFEDSSIDGIIANHILEHFNGEDLIFIVEEMWRVCRPNTEIGITVPGHTSPNRGKDFTHKKTDWDQWSFQMWEKKDGEYLIERGPLYGIHGEFIVGSFLDMNLNMHYGLTVIKSQGATL